LREAPNRLKVQSKFGKTFPKAGAALHLDEISSNVAKGAHADGASSAESESP
jgi:hypothetical protein